MLQNITVIFSNILWLEVIRDLGYTGIMKIQYKDLKKNDEIRTTQLGTPVSGKLLESPKQGRGLKKTLMIYSNAKEIGMFNEAGSVYASEIIEVKRDGAWLQVTGQPQINGVKDLYIRNFIAAQWQLNGIPEAPPGASV